ncbi:hypothetical protein BJ912DRAFT_845297 [Pholiota molesta]|nr:hypothetical protein BJ912DRAFT_845297 [Pholiota molesta]
MFSPAGNDDDASVEEMYRQIDEAIQQHQNSISALRSRRNALAPISRLPPEVFCHIFLFAKARHSRRDEEMHPLEWIKLTHVSHHWRNIAVNSPNLWVDLPVLHLHWTEEMLRRSKNASVIINASLGTPDSVPPGLELALKHSSRIEDFSLRLEHLPPNVGDLSIWDQLLKRLPATAPRLQSLSIVLWTNKEDIEFGFRIENSDTVSLPEHVLCKTERLRHLELTNCDINWSSHSHLLHSLTYLKLHSLSKTSRPTGQQFLDALNEMPHLESLDLQEALPIQTEKQVSWASGHIHLTSLRNLNIRSTDTEIGPFFSCITFRPRTTVMVVVCSTVNNQATTGNFTRSANSIVSNLARLYSSPSSAKTFKTIVLQNPQDDFGPGVQLRLFESTLTMKEMRMRSIFTPLLELVFVYEDSTRQAVANVMTDLFSGAIPLRHVEQVCLEEMIPGIEPKMMVKTIGALPRVQFVMVSYDACNAFLCAAAHQVRVHLRSKGSGNAVTPVKKLSLSFRSLRSLCLCDARFIKLEPDSDEITIGMLQDFLIRRYEYGVEIRQLTLRYCRGLSGKEVDLLAEIVVGVDWDGEVIPDTDDSDEDDEDEDDEDDSDEDDEDDSDEDFF